MFFHALTFDVLTQVIHSFGFYILNNKTTPSHKYSEQIVMFNLNLR